MVLAKKKKKKKQKYKSIKQDRKYRYKLTYLWSVAAAAKSLQSCLSLCDPIDGSLPGSPIPGILQARTLEWVAISFSNAWKWKVEVKSLSRVRPSATPWIAAFQALPSMGFSRQEYWSGVPLQSVNLWQKEARIYTGERTISSISVAGKTGQLYIKEWN